MLSMYSCREWHKRKHKQRNNRNTAINEQNVCCVAVHQSPLINIFALQATNTNVMCRTIADGLPCHQKKMQTIYLYLSASQLASRYTNFADTFCIIRLSFCHLTAMWARMGLYWYAKLPRMRPTTSRLIRFVGIQMNIEIILYAMTYASTIRARLVDRCADFVRGFQIGRSVVREWAHVWG